MIFVRNGTSCPFCGSSNLRRFSIRTNKPAIGPRTVQVVECRECITAWQWPGGFSEADTKEYYKKQYNSQGDIQYFNKEHKTKLANIELDFLESVTKGPGSLLDVGAGAGIFVDLAISRGWLARGVDLSHTSENVIQGSIDDVNGKFDAITMWDVIEHVEDPAKLIMTAAEMLSDDGVLIIETGNYMSTDRILGEERWWAFHPDHRWFHAPSLIESLLRNAGFAHIEFARQKLRPEAAPVANYPGPTVSEFIVKVMKRPHQVRSYIRQFADLKTSASRHPHLSRIGVFAVAARKGN